MHKRVRVEKQGGGRQIGGVWNKVLECDPLRRLIKISVVPTATKKDIDKWLSLGAFSSAWVWRSEESPAVGGTIWRLPGGDMYWGLEQLSLIVKSAAEARLKSKVLRAGDEESDAEEVGEDMNYGAEGKAGEVGERVGRAGRTLMPSLMIGLVSALPHSLVICWVPSGSKVHVSVANKNGSEWRKIYSGKHGGCQVSKLGSGTGYRFKVECDGRRPR